MSDIDRDQMADAATLPPKVAEAQDRLTNIVAAAIVTLPAAKRDAALGRALDAYTRMHYVVKRAREAFRGVIAQAAARAICDGGLAGNPTEYSLAIENAVHRAVAKIFAESDKLAEIEPF
jgi:hypothetical protein